VTSTITERQRGRSDLAKEIGLWAMGIALTALLGWYLFGSIAAIRAKFGGDIPIEIGGSLILVAMVVSGVIAYSIYGAVSLHKQSARNN
jgi:flagellin-like protein